MSDTSSLLYRYEESLPRSDASAVTLALLADESYLIPFLSPSSASSFF